MICFPNAKINIGLQIKGKRKDGFHNIETVFYPVTLSDILEITPFEGAPGDYKLINTGDRIDVDPGENLCVTAWSEINKIRSLPAVSIHIHKIIPSGAGLGGGSSDAAFVLKGLSEYFSLKISGDELASIAGGIGSDCPFFLSGKPSIATGRGEILKPAGIDLSGMLILLVFPGISVNTGWAYSNIRIMKHPEPVEDIIKANPGNWQGRLTNDFEAVVFKEYPVIRKIRNKLLTLGALYASMTGSGSAVFGLFDQKAGLTDLKHKFPGMFTWEGIL